MEEKPVNDPVGLGAERARTLETATVAKLLFNAWDATKPEPFTAMAKAIMPLLSTPGDREHLSPTPDMVRAGISMFEDCTGERLPDAEGEDAKIVRAIYTAMLQAGGATQGDPQ